MDPTHPTRLRVFVDADVLFAGSASPSKHGASLVVLRLAEVTLIEAVTSRQVIAEVERNLEDKLPHALPAMRLLISRCLQVVPGPQPQELVPHAGTAHRHDLPILVAALREGCPWLITFNVRDYQPGHPDVTVLRPGEFVRRVRDLLVHMTSPYQDPRP
jgi:predicted nucleic acid-binding protein